MRFSHHNTRGNRLRFRVITIGTLFAAMGAMTGMLTTCSTNSLEKKPKAIWKRRIGNRGATSSPRIGTDGRIFLSGVDPRGEAYCLSAKNGSLKWKMDVRQDLSPPLVVGERVLFGLYDGGLLALDALTGARLWEWRGPKGPLHVRRMAAVGDLVVVGGEHLTGVRVRDGTEAWSLKLGDRCIALSVPSQRRAFVGCSKSTVAVDLSGEPKILWRAPYGGQCLAASASTALVCTRDYRLVSLNSGDGSLQWIVEPAQAGGSYSPIFGLDGRLYVGGCPDLCTYDAATGHLLWRAGDEMGTYSFPVEDGRGVVYIGTRRNDVRAYSGKTGRMLWRYPFRWSFKFLFGTRGVLTPTLSESGILYVASDDSNVYALQGKSSGRLSGRLADELPLD